MEMVTAVWDLGGGRVAVVNYKFKVVRCLGVV